MRKSHSLSSLFVPAAALALVIVATPASAALSLLAPKTYTVPAGQDATFTESVALPPTACNGEAAVYTLVIANGNADGTAKVKTGSIAINGETIFDQEFAQSVGTFEKPVVLGATNGITLTFHAQTNEAAVVTVSLERQITTPILAEKSFAVSSPNAIAEFQETFPLPAGQPGPYTLIFVNGGGTTLPVDEADISVNGTGVIDIEGPNNPGQTIVRNVLLQTENTIKIDLKSKKLPAGVTLRVVRPVDDTKGPTITLSTAQDGIVTTPTVAVAGSVSDAIGVRAVEINGSLVPVAAGGAFTSDVALAGGRNTIGIEAIDCEGNRSRVELVAYRDVALPQIAITDPASNALFNVASVTVNGTTSDDIGVASVVVNGVVATIVDGIWSATVPFTEGVRQVAAVATDRAGQQTTAMISITVDTTAPTITSSVSPEAPANGWYNAAPAITFTCNDALSGIELCTSPVTVTTDGEQAIQGLAADKAGNVTMISVPIKVDSTAPAIQAIASPSSNSDGWLAGNLTVGFLCNDDTSGVASCTDPLSFTSEGAGQVATGEAVDQAGNRATATFTVNIDRTAPTLTVTPPGEVVATAQLTVQGTAGDSNSGLKDVRCGNVAATVNGSSFICSLPLSEGPNVATVVATDRADNETRTFLALVRDTTAPLITLESPVAAAITNAATITVKGEVTDVGGLASVTVAGQPVTLTGNQFGVEIPLNEGANTIAVVATDRAGNRSTANGAATRFTIPSVAIDSPADLALVRTPTVTVRGTIGSGVTAVTVDSQQATITGNTFVANDVPLSQGRTVITATASSPTGSVATASVNIYRDSIPPRLEVYSPKSNATVYTSSVSITGMVDDIVVGTVNAGQVQVNVNGRSAEVANRAFLIPDVALAPGLNNLTITAIDQGGNTTVLPYSVTYSSAPALPHIEMVSGNGQRAAIDATLPQPIVVRVADANGAPLANRAITFTIIANDGALTDGTRTGRIVNVSTDAGGQASVRWTLGSRAGAGNNRVEARGTGIAGIIEFDAIATTGQPSLIVVDSGDDQFGVVGAELPRPLVAVVVDSGSNRLANVPVTFSVIRGGGNFNGQTSITVQTDSDGRAIAQPVLGSLPGQDNHRFNASVTGVAVVSTFKASGRTAGPASETKISGVVLDNSSTPVAGVSLRVEGTSLMTQSDAAGQFIIEPAPVGYVKLIVDGSTAQRAGTWPSLEFSMFTLPGNDNTIGMPIYLLPVDVQRGLQVTETTGGTLTLPELPGFSLTVKPGSVTFPGGSRIGTVSVTLVHSDKMPMTPGFGQQPRFIVTIQPPGAHFDPPAAISFPNVDGLPPGAITEMYSFDHDLGQFVAIGTGSISADGTELRSDPGVGIIKGGWHCGGDPASPGTSANCPQCFKCVGEDCVPDAARNGGQCTGDACQEQTVCQNGNCVGTPKKCAECMKCVNGICSADPAQEAALCTLENKCLKNIRCINGDCSGDEVDIADWKNLQGSAEVTLPDGVKNALNKFFGKIIGEDTVGIDALTLGIAARAKDCCDPDQGIRTAGIRELTGKFAVKGKFPLTLTRPVKFDLLQEIGPFLVGLRARGEWFVPLAPSISAEGGTRADDCLGKSCAIGSVSSSVSVGVTAKLLVSACVSRTVEDTHCLTEAEVSGSATVSGGLSYKYNECEGGGSGSYNIGKSKLSGKVKVYVFGEGFDVGFEWEFLPGFSGSL